MLRASEWKVTKRASGWDDAKIGKTGLSPKESRAWERGFVSGACRCAQACLSRGWGCASRGQRLHSSSPLHSKPWDRHKGRNRLGEMFLCPVKRKPATFNLRTKGNVVWSRKMLPQVTVEVTGCHSLWETVWGQPVKHKEVKHEVKPKAARSVGTHTPGISPLGSGIRE